MGTRQHGPFSRPGAIRAGGRLIGPLAAAALFLGSCASTNHYRKIDEAAAQGRYEESVAALEQNKNKLYRDKDVILFYLDKGLLTHYAGEWDDSIELLQDGERAIEEAYTKSITMEIGSYILNDTTREYPGEDYEDIYINTFNALNYYHKGSLEEAMVEVRRMGNKLRFLASKYGVVASNLQKKALEDSAEIPPNEEIGSVQFNDSALARYLGLLFYRAAGQEDDARIDRDGLKIAFANAPRVYAYPVPQSIDEDLEIPPGKARLNVIAFSGLSPIKEQQDLRIPIPGPRYIKIALPVMTYRPSQVGRIEVALNTGARFDLELLEDIEAVARETFKEREKLIYMKSIIRGTVKGVASAAMGIAGEQVDGTAGLILSLASIGTQVAAEASEQADLRISRYFPAKAYVGGITLEPGMYTITVNYYGRNGGILASYTDESVLIQEKALNLWEALCIR
ncbi:MAG: hypothetical protein LBD37_04045 [Treponema sp.]|jgi:hypothetical protein|nr:hypothetical protein [Treponema sp.]